MAWPPSRGTVWAELMVSSYWRRCSEPALSADEEEELQVEQMDEFPSDVRQVFLELACPTGQIPSRQETEVQLTGVTVFHAETCSSTKPTLYLAETRLAWVDLSLANSPLFLTLKTPLHQTRTREICLWREAILSETPSSEVGPHLLILLKIVCKVSPGIGSLD